MYEEIISEIEKRKARRVLLQIPEGLKMGVQDMAGTLEKSGAEIVISVETCYGGCDLRDLEAKRLGCDLIVHVGHSDFGVKPEVPVYYWEYRMDFDPLPVLRKSRELDKYRNIGLVTTVQYLESLDEVRDFLLSKDKNVLVGKSKRGHPGQILGCDYTSALVLEDLADCFIYIGSGRFHPLGLIRKTSKPVFILSPESHGLEKLERDRKAEISMEMATQKARDSRKFGILVSTKPGQENIENALEIKKTLEDLGKSAWILAGDEITPEKLLGLDIEILVNTTCPRMRDDRKVFGKTIIDAEDVKKMK